MPAKSNLPEIYAAIKPLFEAHIPPFSVYSEGAKGFEITSTKTVEVWGKKRDGIYFGGVKIQKGFVGFYLMHIYAQPGEVEKIGPELRKRLKGKSCFHITKVDKVLLAQMKKALADGRKCYKKLGWL